MNRVFNRRGAFVVLAGAFVGSLSTVVAFAAIPNSDTGVINACRDNSTGALRAIDAQAGASCSGSESALRWSSQIKGNLMIDKLHDADLSGARLQYLDLQGVNLTNSQFSDTTLTGSDLRNADLSGATMAGAILDRVQATGANFSHTAIQMVANQATINDANFSYADVVSITGGDYSGSDFTHTTLGAIDSVNMASVDFRNSVLEGAGGVLHNVDLTSANFSGMTFSSNGYSFNSVNLTNADLTNSVFSASSSFVFENANTTNTNFSGTSFANVIFSTVNLSTANLTDTTWSNVTCPDGTNSDNNGATCLGHLVP